MSDLSVDDRMDRWAIDWRYETDSLLVHSSGFAVQFDASMPRSRALGEIISGSAAGYSALIEHWAKEPNADDASISTFAAGHHALSKSTRRHHRRASKSS